MRGFYHAATAASPPSLSKKIDVYIGFVTRVETPKNNVKYIPASVHQQIYTNTYKKQNYELCFTFHNRNKQATNIV